MNEADPPELADPDRLMTFGRVPVPKPLITAALVFILFSSVGLTVLLRQVMTTMPSPVLGSASIKKTVGKALSIPKGGTDQAGKFIEQLKALNLWDITPASEIPPVLFPAYPENLYKLADIDIKKKVFINTLLPVALVALREVEAERRAISEILGKINRVESDSADLAITGDDLNESSDSWRQLLGDAEEAFLDRTCRKYRTTRLDELLDRVDVIPVSLILGQGAIESSWGGSRFARVGKNLFGIWTWGEKGIVPAQREKGQRHKIRAYDTILDSVRDYILTLNRLAAYNRFRLIRRQTADPLALADGLKNYSERKAGYVRDLKRVIISNNLQDYDTCILEDGPPQTWRYAFRP